MLVVEDEWAIADWLEALLGDGGHDVLVANNGKRALEMMAQTQPDLVLTDVMMPVMDGPSLLGAMKRNGFLQIPVIMMSALPEATVKERCNGYHAFMRKPFRESELLSTVRRVLGGGG